MPNTVAQLLKRLTRKNTRRPSTIAVVAPESDPYVERLKNLLSQKHSSAESHLYALPRYFYLPLKNSIESKGHYAYLHNQLYKYIHSGMKPNEAVKKAEENWKRLKKTKSKKEMKAIENEAIYDLKYSNYKRKSLTKSSRTNSLSRRNSLSRSKTKKRPRSY